MSKLKEKHFKTKGALYPFLKRLFIYSFRYKKWITGFIIFVLLVAAVEAIFPVVWLNLIDNVIVPLVEGRNPTTGSEQAIDLSGLKFYTLIFFAWALYLHSVYLHLFILQEEFKSM